MPANSTFSPDDKAKVRAALPQPAFKIHTAALARVYYAHPDPNTWAYAGLQGALALVKDGNKGGVLSLALVDLSGTRGVIWSHELYDGFEYFQDRPFFHSFAGDVRKRGSRAGAMLTGGAGMHDRNRLCGRGRGEEPVQEGHQPLVQAEEDRFVHASFVFPHLTPLPQRNPPTSRRRSRPRRAAA
jgi:hypothetical protein